MLDAFRHRLLVRFGLAVTAAAVAFYVAELVYYVLGATMGGHGESSVLCIAWGFREGRPVYPDVDAATRYGMVYGPMTPLAWGGLFKVFGPHVMVVRVAAGIMALLGLACCWRAYHKVDKGHAAVLGFGWLVLVYLKYTIITYYVRPDTPLMLCMGLALWAAVVSRGWRAWVIMGLALGWGVGLKITMPVYVLPVLVLLVQRRGWGAAARACAVGAALAVLPFVMFPQISAGNFWAWLTTAVDEGVERTMIVPVGGYFLLLSAPPAAALGMLALRRPAAFKALVYRYRWFGISAALSVLVVLRITGKPGAGPSHLLPLWPVLGVVLVKALAVLGADQQATDRHGPTPTGKWGMGERRWMTGVVATGGVLAVLVMMGFAIKGAWWGCVAGIPMGGGAGVCPRGAGVGGEAPGRGRGHGRGKQQGEVRRGAVPAGVGTSRRAVRAGCAGDDGHAESRAGDSRDDPGIYARRALPVLADSARGGAV